jgi:hypothetical protein
VSPPVAQVLVNLEEGLGVSLINKLPEELVFTTLAGIDVHFTRTASNEVLELSIQTIQVSGASGGHLTQDLHGDWLLTQAHDPSPSKGLAVDRST